MRYTYIALAAIFAYFIPAQAHAQDWARYGVVKDTVFATSQAQASTVDISGNTYITGIFGAPFMAFGVDTLWEDTTGNMPIVKYDRFGNVVWAKNLVGGGQPTSMASDRYGNVYIAGMYNSDSLTLGTYTLHRIDSAWNFFLFKMDPAGNITWGRSGNTGAPCNLTYDHSNISVSLDTFDKVYLVAGYVRNSITLESTTLTNTTWGKLEGMLAKYDSAGALIWLKGVAGDDDDYIMSSTTDKEGNIFTGGMYKSSTLDYGTVSISATPGTSLNGFITKQDSAGNALWSRSLPSMYNSINSMNAGDDGSLYFTGFFYTSATLGTTTLNQVCTGNGYLARYSPAGDFNWVKQVGNGLILSSAISPITKNIWICGRFGYSSGSFGCEPYAIIGADTLACPVVSPGTTNPNFIAEIDTAGNLVYATAYTSGGFITNVSVDTAGYLLYTGTYMGNAPFVIAGDTLPMPTSDIFIDHGYFFASRMAPHPPITGADLILCTGVTDTLSNISPGGHWSSSDTDVVTVDTAGVIMGIAAGTATITYDYAAGSAFAIVTITVNASAITGGITGDSTVCEGSSITLTAVSGGTWSVSNPSASVSGGVVTGITAGVDTISYSISSTCATEVAVRVVTVNALPSAITGSLSVCTGDTTLLASTPGAGWWTSSDPTVGTIDTALGEFAALSAGTSLVSYTTIEGCMVTTVVTANTTPSTITGSLSLCTTTSSLLASITPGGTWSSSGMAVGTISSGGNLDGLTPGTTVISYSMPSGCAVSAVATVNLLPSPVTGPSALCEGSLAAYADVSAGGIWSTSDLAVGSINAASGILAGLTPGTSLVIYTLPSGCAAAFLVIVNPLPAPIAGVLSVCSGSSTTLSSTTTGGSWTSGSGAVASIGFGTGIANGLTPGTSVINYRLPTGCYVTAVLTVDALPGLSSSLTPPAICDSTVFSYVPTSAGSSPTFSWSRAAITGILPTTGAGVDNPNELLENTTTASIGVTYIYTVTAGGCSGTSSVVVSVNPYPVLSSSLTPAAICDSAVFSYVPASLTPGAAFSWSRAFVAGISSLPGTGTGNPNELLHNTTTIPIAVTYVYTISAGGCSSVQNVGVTIQPTPRLSNTLPPPAVCSGTPFSFIPTSLTTGVGYAWARPLVTGISNPPAAGTGNITETLVNTTAGPVYVTYRYFLTIGSCTDTQLVTVGVNPATDAGTISGPDTVCAGVSMVLTNPVVGGTWSSGSANATVSGGIVTGVTAGAAVISYSVTGLCGVAVATKSITVLPASACMTLVNGHVASEPALIVFPNPSDGAFTVSLQSVENERVDMAITDIAGRKIAEFAADTNHPETVKLPGCNGVYLLQAITPHGKYVKQIVVR